MSTANPWKPWQGSPSLSASMEDFESATTGYSSDLSRISSNTRIPALRTPALQSPIASTYSDTTDDALQNSWSPPAWRKAGSGWFRHQAGLASPISSHAGMLEKAHDLHRLQEEEDVDDDEDGDLTAAAEVPLPRSPTKGRSLSPSRSPERFLAPPIRETKSHTRTNSGISSPDKSGHNNYIRFSMRADVQHRTEPIEDAVAFVRKSYNRATKSKYRMFLSLLSCLLATSTITFLFSSPIPPPAPDLIKVAGMANTFEPLMHYSERGHSQVAQLGDTSVAVWDLSESVRSTNMTSGPIIVKTLDGLSDSLKSLTQELTTFFANINGDIDHILLVMEWAQRELGKLTSLPESRASTVFSNLHTLFSKVGILESPRTGAQTAVGKFVQDLFGPTNQQRTRNTLERTFMDMLGVLEESINNELTASHSLFAHFEAIDRQFLNLQRTVLRETDTQEREESEILASLWSRMMGGNAALLKKFEKNKQLLASLRGRTVQNKHVLVDHNGRLLQLRSNLEILRKKLVSPIVRSNQSSSLSVEEQLQGLEGTYNSLWSKREAQKTRIYELIAEGSNAGGRNPSIHAIRDDSYMIGSS